MSLISDLVKDAKLSTKLDLEFTTHTFIESSLVAGRRPRRREREEKWRRKRHLGMGVFGMVWLEECMTDIDAKLRVVKEVRRVAPGPKPIDYSRELEAFIKFSQQKFDGCFVKCSGWFESDDLFFICTEYFLLGDLQNYIHEPFLEREAQHITLQLLEGLDFMHSSGFAHYDLRPRNIFVRSKNPEWWVKIGDFGIDKRVMEGLTGRQTFNGAPTFTAPEVYKTIWEPSSETGNSSSESDFNPEVDIWSLGVISYYLLAGKLPFYTQRGLFAYYNKESTLPTEWLYTLQCSEEAVQFLKDILAPSPSDRITAGDALDHDWLSSLLQESSPVEPNEPLPSEKSIPPLQPRRLTNSHDVMLPGTIHLTSSPTILGPGIPMTLPHSQPGYRASLNDHSQQDTISQHQYHQHMMLTATQPNGDHLPMQSNMGSLGVDDMYKPRNPSITHGLSALHLLSNVHPLHRPALEQASIEQSQCRESQCSDSSLRLAPLRRLSSPDVSTADSVSDSLPPYSRRRSDAAPIPISDLNFITPRAESPSDSRSQSSTVESSRGSLERHSSERRFSDKIRRVSESVMSRRQNRSVDHGKKKDKDKPSETSLPISRSSSTTTKGSETKKSSGKKAKSQVVQIPGRAQFAEGLPLFPVRVKRA
ncbi:hypothetical protein N7488_002973 [Penicillium malachiteum]|nr:hypothetical protein N7488_002973 [Penicillium malachiteum]